MQPYSNYHARGYNLQDIGKLYVSPSKFQSGRNYYYAQGRGLSNVFRGVWSFLRPLLVQSSKAIGSELLKGSADVIENLGGDKSFRTLVEEERDKRLSNLSQRAMNKLTKLQSGNNIRSLAIKRKKKPSSNLIRGLLAQVEGDRRRGVKKRVIKKKTNKKKKRKPAKKRRSSKKLKSDIFDY